MSVKHIKDYYFQLGNDYKELLAEVHDLEEAVSEHLVFPEQLEQVKAQLETLKTNYSRISYIMFLLDMPNKDSKQKRYIKQSQKILNNIPSKDTLDGVKAENKLVLAAFNNKIKEFKDQD